MDDQLFPALLAEVPNFRDLGGVGAGAGREFRRGVVFRTQALTGLSAEAQAELLVLGLTRVVDLRMEKERIDLPVTVPGGIAVLVADVVGSASPNGAAAAGAAATGKDIDQPVSETPGGKDMMLETYRNFIQLPTAQAAYSAFARSVMETDGAVAVYCAAGKDRTGWAAAFLQNFAGVDEATAIQEYAKSNVFLVSRYGPRIESVRVSGGDLEAFKALVNANPDYLAEAFAFMRARYGNIEGYMTNALGFSQAELAALEGRIVSEI
ncbi:MAG: tyrosine-protein phosphatase [Actinomycetota bacterium]|nr:tyrosine-protein phosphatase [Actinomycetota bacterium]